MARVALSLGSNLDPEQHLRRATAELRARYPDVRYSPVYRSAAVGFDGPDFLNLCAVLHSAEPPEAIDAWLHALEQAHGRRRDQPRFSSRPLDVDLLLYDDRVLRGPGHLELPRPELVEQEFVLRPLADLAPEWIHPTLGRSIGALWAAFPPPHRLIRVDGFDLAGGQE